MFCMQMSLVPVCDGAFKFISLSNRKSQLLLNSASVLRQIVYSFRVTDWQYSCCREELALSVRYQDISPLLVNSPHDLNIDDG